MEIVHARSCGLDVHKKSVVACVLITQPDGFVERHMRTFKTMTADLVALDGWLSNHGVTHVALESTGVYWRPVFNVLEDERRTLLLVNPQHMRAVPGKKTDGKDAEWLADLLRHGLLRASFIPPAPVRALRELTRYRKTLVQERADETNRLHKTLEGANLKLAGVATDVLGVSGRAMFAALLDGERDPDVLAELARGKLRAKMPELRLALEGRVQSHHLVLINQILTPIDALGEAIAEVQVEIEHRLKPFEDLLAVLQTIPGIKPIAAAAIGAEIGTDIAVSRDYPRSSGGPLLGLPGVGWCGRLVSYVMIGAMVLKARRSDLSQRAGRPDGVIYRQQFVRCGKDRCRKCVPEGRGHGPYWFGYYWDYSQRTKSFYVGKHLPAGVELIDEVDNAQVARNASGSG